MKPRICLAAILVVVAGACSSSSKPSAKRSTGSKSGASTTTQAAGTGVVRGRLAGATKGGIVVAVGGGHRYTTGAGDDNRFELRLPSGSYAVTGRSYPLSKNGRVDCTTTREVAVAPGSTSSVVLTCAR
jgi:hypothetical protein